MDAMATVNSKVLHPSRACGVAVRRIEDFSDVPIPATCSGDRLIWGSDQKKQH